MWLILQQQEPEDFVIATGITTTVRDFVVKVFDNLGISLEFEGEGKKEVARIAKCTNPDFKVKQGQIVVQVDHTYYRPTEVDLLIGDPIKAKEKLGWNPKYNLDQLVEDMVRSDLELFKKDKYLHEGGHRIFNYHEE